LLKTISHQTDDEAEQGEGKGGDEREEETEKRVFDGQIHIKQ